MRLMLQVRENTLQMNQSNVININLLIVHVYNLYIIYIIDSLPHGFVSGLK